MSDTLTTLNEKISALETDASALLAKLNNNPGEVESVRTDLKSISDRLAPLEAEREKALVQVELDDMKAQVQTINEALEGMRGWNPGLAHERALKDGKAVYGEGSDYSFYLDIAQSMKGDRKALARLEDAKAMVEGTDSAGGYLVTPEISSELVQLKIAQTPLRGLMSSVGIVSDTLTISTQTSGLTAGWVAELATKPQADFVFGQFSVSVFTGAGLAVVSNQLLKDAGRGSRGPQVGIDTLINRDLAKRLAILEEVAFINGSGTGQPLGILGTSGVNTVTISTGTTVTELLDGITDAILAVQTNFLGNPTAILMHPRTWTRIIKARESTSPSTYLIGAGSTAFGRRANDAIPGGGIQVGSPVGDLFGYPVYLSFNIPTNLGAGTNESRVIVGDFSEGLILDREGVQLDTSEHVYFTSNQTVFRAEMRVGFTAARYPKAFAVVQGTNLVNG